MFYGNMMPKFLFGAGAGLDDGGDVDPPIDENNESSEVEIVKLTGMTRDQMSIYDLVINQYSNPDYDALDETSNPYIYDLVMGDYNDIRSKLESGKFVNGLVVSTCPYGEEEMVGQSALPFDFIGLGESFIVIIPFEVSNGVLAESENALFLLPTNELVTSLPE